MEYNYNKKENKFTENGHTMFMEDVLQRLKRLLHLESRIKELENNTTELIQRSGNITHDYWYYCQECLHDLETDNQNFCPNCGRKIIKK